MIQLIDHGVYLVDGVPQDSAPVSRQEAREQTMAWKILQLQSVCLGGSVVIADGVSRYGHGYDHRQCQQHGQELPPSFSHAVSSSV